VELGTPPPSLTRSHLERGTVKAVVYFLRLRLGLLLLLTGGVYAVYLLEGPPLLDVVAYVQDTWAPN
jgi:hypothetical protein